MSRARKRIHVVGVFSPTAKQRDKRIIYKGWKQMVSIRHTRYRKACESGDETLIAEALIQLEKYKLVFGAEIMLIDGVDPRSANFDV